MELKFKVQQLVLAICKTYLSLLCVLFMTEKWRAISPIPQLFLDSNLTVDDFTIMKSGISSEEFKSTFDIDFDEESFNELERDVWVSSPVYVREFEAESDFFGIAQKHLHHFLDTVVLFKPSRFFMPKHSLLVKRIQRGEGVNSTRDFGPLGRYQNLVFEIKDDEHESFKDFFKKCYQYFTHSPSNDIDQSIHRSALKWLSKGRQTISVFEREIFFSIAFEALIGERQSELTFRLQRRCASLLGKDQSQCEEIFNIIKTNYDLRSNLVHGNILRETRLDETYDMAEIIRCLLLRLISLSKKNYTRKELLPKLDSIFDNEARNQIIADAKELFEERTEFNPFKNN